MNTQGPSFQALSGQARPCSSSGRCDWSGVEQKGHAGCGSRDRKEVPTAQRVSLIEVTLNC